MRWGLIEMSNNPLAWIGRALGALLPGVRDVQGHLAAISRTTPIIEFDLNGLVLNANEMFLKASGYKLSEIRGQHHRMFADTDQKDSNALHELWAALRRGEMRTVQEKR